MSKQKKIYQMDFFKSMLALFFLIAILIFPFFVFASAPDPLGAMSEVAGEGGFTVGTDDDTKISMILGLVVKSFLGLLGIIFIILILYAGYNWMTAGGNESKVEKAQQTLTRAIIGLVLIVGSYAIWLFIFNAVLEN